MKQQPKFDISYAEAIIKAAIEAGTIKLTGTSISSTEAGAEEMAKIDAKYLLTLFAELTGATQSPD